MKTNFFSQVTDMVIFVVTARPFCRDLAKGSTQGKLYGHGEKHSKFLLLFFHETYVFIKICQLNEK